MERYLSVCEYACKRPSVCVWGEGGVGGGGRGGERERERVEIQPL